MFSSASSAVVTLLAISLEKNTTDLSKNTNTNGNKNGSEIYDKLKLIPTAYKMPTDNINMVKVIGSQSGRIFMGGTDGNLYELEYESSESPWSAVFNTGPSQKCRKINHTNWGWKMLNIIPPFLRTGEKIIDPLVDILIDNIRNVLYCTSINGNISIYDLKNTSTNTVPIIRNYHVLTEVKKWLCMNQSTRDDPRLAYFKDPKSIFIIGIYSIPSTEARTVSTVIILSNGVRIYFRLLGHDRKPYSYSVRDSATPSSSPIGIDIVHVRYPPSRAEIKYVQNLENDFTYFLGYRQCCIVYCCTYLKSLEFFIFLFFEFLIPDIICILNEFEYHN